MSTIQTRFFGEIEYIPDSVLQFPNGIPGFEEERSFVFIHEPAKDPLMFLQSVETKDLCFVALPVLAIDPAYALNLDEDDCSQLRLPNNAGLRIGEDIVCVALISTQPGETPRANLMAPVVVNLYNRVGAQLVRSGSQYSSRHPLSMKEAAACS